jgi:hypothetical protein
MAQKSSTLRYPKTCLPTLATQMIMVLLLAKTPVGHRSAGDSAVLVFCVLSADLEAVASLVLFHVGLLGTAIIAFVLLTLVAPSRLRFALPARSGTSDLADVAVNP